MYLSDTDIKIAIDNGSLIVHPIPKKIGPTSIDLHLDKVDQAQIWDIDKLKIHNQELGRPPLELDIARMQYGKISRKFLMPPPLDKDSQQDSKVVRRDDCVVLRPGGFVLWLTREIVGTPEESPKYICFVDGKSTRARTGLVVHLTAPTIHAGWSGNITLEMANFGSLDIVLHEGDDVAQLVVAKITSPPSQTHKQAGSSTLGQTSVTGA